MRNLKYIHKIYIIVFLSIITYTLGSIAINIYSQQKTFNENLKIDLTNFTGAMADLALMLRNEDDTQNRTVHYSNIPVGFDNEKGFIPIIFKTSGEVVYYYKRDIPSNILNEIDVNGNKYIQELSSKAKTTEPQGSINFKKEDDNGQVIEWLMHYYYIPELDWIAATSVNMSFYRSLMKSQIGLSILFSAIFLTLIVIITVLIGNTFNKQLKNLTSAVIKYSNKEFTARADIKSNDEISKLARLFNKMADNIDELHSGLQEKIDERTIALQHGNEELQLQNEEIEQQNEEIRAINDEMQAMNNDLQESERKTRRLIENLEDEYIFYSQKVNGDYTYVSPSITKLLGYSEEDVKKGIKPYLTNHPKNKVAKEAADKNAKGEKQPPFEIEIKDKQNNLRQFELLEVPIFDANKKVIKVEGLAHEITKRKRNEQVQKILNHISTAVLTSENLEDLITIIRDQLNTILDTQNFYIALYDKETETCSLPFLADEKDDIQRFPVAKTMTGHVIKTKKSLLVTAAQQEKMASKGIIEFVGSKSKVWLGSPLHLGSKIMGVIAVQSYTDVNAYNEKDREILEIISNQISLSIERIKANEKLSEEKDYAERILTVVPSAVFTVDKNKIITSWNKKAETITGWNAHETIGKSCDKLSLTPCMESCGLYDKSIEKPITNQEYDIVTRDGRNITIIKNADCLLDAEGNVIGGIESFEDISQRKRSELIQHVISNITNSVNLNKNLEDLVSYIQDQLSELLDTSNFYIALYNEESDTLTLPFIADEQDKFEEFPAAGTMTGYVIKNKKSILADEIVMNKLEKKGEIELIGAPSKIWLGVPLIIENKVIGALAVQNYHDKNAFDNSDLEVLNIVSHQISRSIERKRNSEELKATNVELETQKEELQTTLDSLQETQSQLIQSEKMAALGQLIAGIAHEINTPLGAINASIGNMSDSLDTAIGNLPKLLSQMGKEDLYLYLKLMKLADNNSPELTSKERRQLKRELSKIIQSHNISEPERIAEMLIYMKVNKQIDKVLPLLETPNAQFVLSNARHIFSLRKNTQNINMAVTKASKVVFALKKFAHRDYIGEKVESDIVDGIETVLTLYHNQIKQGVEIIRSFTPIPPIWCYQDEINQVWANLFHNSLQAMNNKGTIEIFVETADEGICVKIKDTGGGIPNELKEQIFKPFFTTKKAGEGSGIGLDIVKKIIDKHGGKIDFESEKGVGTTFKIWLPSANK